MPLRTETHISEIDLISDLKKGDKMAFAQLFDRFSPLALTLTQELNLNDQRTEEVLLACFINISKNIQAFNPSQQRLFTWILNCLRTTLTELCSEEVKQYEIRNKINYVQPNRDLLNPSLIRLLMLYKGRLDELAVLRGMTKQELMDLVKNNINQLKK